MLWRSNQVISSPDHSLCTWHGKAINQRRNSSTIIIIIFSNFISIININNSFNFVIIINIDNSFAITSVGCFGALHFHFTFYKGHSELWLNIFILQNHNVKCSSSWWRWLLNDSGANWPPPGFICQPSEGWFIAMHSITVKLGQERVMMIMTDMMMMIKHSRQRWRQWKWALDDDVVW